MMITNRLVILATVEAVQNYGHSYLSCSRCFSKVLYDTESTRWMCMKCRSDCERPMQRYRLNFQIVDSTRICNITVFGQNLNKFFGCTADEFDRYLRQFSESHPQVFADESVVAAIISKTFVGHNFLFGFKVPSIRLDRGDTASLDMIRPRAEGKRSSVVAWQMLFPSKDHSFTTVMSRFHCFVGNIDSNHSVKKWDFYEDSLSSLSAADIASDSTYGEREFDRGRLTPCSLQSIALSCDQRMESGEKKTIPVSVVQPTYNSGNTICWNSLESPDRCCSPFILKELDGCCGLKILSGIETGNMNSGERMKFKRKRVSCVNCSSIVEPQTFLGRQSVQKYALDLDGPLCEVNFPSFQKQVADTQKRLNFEAPPDNTKLADIGTKIGASDELEMPYSEDLDEFLAKGELKEVRSLLGIQPGLTACLDFKHFTNCSVSSAAIEMQRKYVDCSAKGRLDSRDLSVELFPDLTDSLIDQQTIEHAQEFRVNLTSCRTSRFKFAVDTANASPQINFLPISNRVLCDSSVSNFAFGSDLKAKSDLRLNCRNPRLEENFSCVTPVNAAKAFSKQKVCERLSRLSATWQSKPLSVPRNSKNLRTTLGKILTSQHASGKPLDENSFDLFPSPHMCSLNLGRKEAVHLSGTPVVKFPASSTPLSRLRAHKNLEEECGHSASEILEDSDCILQTPVENYSRTMKNYKTCWNKPYNGKIQLVSAGYRENCERKLISDRGGKNTNLCSQDLFSYSPCDQTSDENISSACEAAKHLPISYSAFGNKQLQQSLKCPNDNSPALGDSEELFSNSDDLFAE